MQRNVSPAGVIFAISSAVLMGTIGVFSKISGLSAETITFFRLLFGACFMSLFLALSGNLRLLFSRPSLPVVINGALLAGFIIFYVQAMNYTTMANAIMLVYFAPLAAAVYAHFFMGERLKLLSLLLIGLALMGFAMILEFNLDLQGDRARATGLSLAALAMLCYSGFILVNRRISDHAYTSTFYQLLVGAMVMLPFFLQSSGSAGGEKWLLLLGVGFFPGFLAILFAVLALKRLPAASFGTLAYFEPLAVVLFGWFLFQESLTPLQIAGCLLILLSGVLKTVAR